MTSIAFTAPGASNSCRLTPLFVCFVRSLVNTRNKLANVSTRKLRLNTMNHALALTRSVCAIAGEPSLIEDIRVEFENNGILTAIQHHDDAVIFEWLAEGTSYQGIADAVVTSYLDQHGRIRHLDIERALAIQEHRCAKLQSYWHFRHCGYRKSAHSCSWPEFMSDCSLPKHNLRNGGLNQSAYSLYLFMRDVAGGDFVSWVDRQLAVADRPMSRNRSHVLCAALLEPLSRVYGLSYKVLSMTLASLLLAGDQTRERWVCAGAGFVAVDTLVHAWLHRTGLLRDLGAAHPYGTRCYGANACAAIIERIARRIDVRTFNPDFPKTFPRFVQKSIWRFCAQSELNRCNGVQIDDRNSCLDEGCPLFTRCDRIALNPDKA